MRDLRRGMSESQIMAVRLENIEGMTARGCLYTAALSASVAHERSERVRCGLMEEIKARPYNEMLQALAAMEAACGVLCGHMKRSLAPREITLADAVAIKGRVQKMHSDLWEATDAYFEPPNV